jgi:hypothetical protein
VTKKSDDRQRRDRRDIPAREDVAAISIDRDNERFILLKKDMLENQLYRDGPRIARSFDKIARPYIKDASNIFAKSQAVILKHLPKLENDGYKATVSRLLAGAANSYIASIEVARHGFKRQFGMISRSLVEALATAIVLAIKPNALEQFHQGTLRSTLCVGWAKEALPPIGLYYGMMNDFVHIGKLHAYLEIPSLYKPDDEALPFILNGLRSNVWLLYVVSELLYADEVHSPAFWHPAGEGYAYAPTDAAKAWMDQFLEPVDLLVPKNKTNDK